MNEPIFLSAEEKTRYSRNIFLKEIGIKGQEILKKSKVLVIGAGGIGSPLLLYLAASGIGNLSFVEFDRIDLTNLQRQILFSTKDIQQEKAWIAKEKLRDLNPHINIQAINEKLIPENAYEIIRDYDLVIDGSDNFATRFLVNDVCFFQNIPLISAGVIRFYGLIMGVQPQKTSCYRCIFEKPPEETENCSTVGVIGGIAGMIGSLASVEAIKFLLGIPDNIMGYLIRFDMLNYEFRFTKLPKNKDCNLCGKNPVIRNFDPKNIDYYNLCYSIPNFLK